MVSKITIIRERGNKVSLLSGERFIVVFHLKKPDSSLLEHKKVARLFNFLFNERIESLRDMRTFES